MLCGVEQTGDVIALSHCLMREWDINYNAYNYIHYGLGAAGVLMPVLSTILSDIDNKLMRRVITGAAAASVSLYAFLSPADKAATYKSAVNELRHMTAFYEQIEKDMPVKGTGANAFILVGAIAEIQERILKSEQANAKKPPQQPGGQNQQGPGAPAPAQAEPAPAQPEPAPQ